MSQTSRYAVDENFRKGKTLARSKYYYKIKTTNPLLHWARECWDNHKSRGFVLTFDIQELIKFASGNLRCYLCGIEVKFNQGKFKDTSITLDRKDNSTILNLENIAICCGKCNAMKRNNSLKELIEWCKEVIRRHAA